MCRPTALALALATTGVLGATSSHAGPAQNGGNGTSVGGPAVVEVPRATQLRLALSPAAAAFMTEIRVRALLDVELQGVLPLAELATGALDEPVARAYIDLPDAASVLIQVQAPGRVLTRRHLDVTGLTWDVAARFTALATAELVRAQLAPLRVRRPRPHLPTLREIDEADRRRPRWTLGAGAHARAGEGPILLGPELELGHATRVLDARLAGRVVAGEDDTRVRAAEVGLSADHRLHATPWLRAELGASIATGTSSATTATSSATVEDDAAGYGRLAARVGAAVRVAPQTWLGLRIEPGLIVGGPDIAGVTVLEGPSIGLTLALRRDLPVGPLVLPSTTPAH